MEINEIVKERWWIVNVEQNSPKQLSQKKTLKNQNKLRKKLQNKSFLWDFGMVFPGISEFGSRLWNFKMLIGRGGYTMMTTNRGRYTMIGWYVLSRGTSKRRKWLDDSTDSGTMTVTERRWYKQQDDYTNTRKRVKTAKTGVFFAFGENFKMLNVVICVLRHFLGDW